MMSQVNNMKIGNEHQDSLNGRGAGDMNANMDPTGFASGAEYLASALGSEFNSRTELHRYRSEWPSIHLGRITMVR